MSYFVEIKPEGFSIWFQLKEIYNHRELLYFFVWRDIKVRYKQTLLGVAWVLVQPVLITFIFAVILSKYAREFTRDIPYWLFAFSGFVFWTFISTGVNNGANCFINHKELVTKVFFPRLLMPVAAVLVSGLDLVLSLLVLLLITSFTLGAFSWKILFLPLFVGLVFLITLSVSILLSALNVRYRDVKHMLPFILQLTMFATPVFYSLDFLPTEWHLVWKLNPLTGAFGGVRSSIFGFDFDFSGILLSILLTSALFVFSLYIFSSMEEEFADII